MAALDSAFQRMRLPRSHPLLARALSALDVLLRRRHSVFEYSVHPSCLFRLQIDRVSRAMVLRDGSVLRTGRRTARLHFWNEHIPAVPANGATIRWGREMQQSIALSLRELAHYLSSRPDLADIAAVCAGVPSGTKTQAAQVARIMSHYGFETVPERGPLPIGERLHRVAENILISLVVFARNASALRLDSLLRVRVPIVLSRCTLEQKFGAAAARPAKSSP
jgi:hypothetical protein